MISRTNADKSFVRLHKFRTAGSECNSNRAPEPEARAGPQAARAQQGKGERVKQRSRVDPRDYGAVVLALTPNIFWYLGVDLVNQTYTHSVCVRIHRCIGTWDHKA